MSKCTTSYVRLGILPCLPVMDFLQVHCNALVAGEKTAAVYEAVSANLNFRAAFITSLTLVSELMRSDDLSDRAF